MDILTALSDEASPTGVTRPCKIQRWLDSIADDTPGKADLVATLTTTDPNAADYRTLDGLDRLLMRLGLTTSVKTIGEHRAGICRCNP